MLLIHRLQTSHRGLGRCYSETLGLESHFWLHLGSCFLRHYGKHNKAWPPCVNEMTNCIFITKHWKTGKGSHSQCWWCVPTLIDKHFFFFTGSLSRVYKYWHVLAEILNAKSKRCMNKCKSLLMVWKVCEHFI